MTCRSGFCRRRSIRNGTPFSTAEGKGQSSPLLFMHPCCSLTGALHAPTTLNVCGMLIFRALGSTLPPEHTLRRARHCVHIVSNYNVAIIVRCTGQHTDINSNSMQGFQMSGLNKNVQLLNLRPIASNKMFSFRVPASHQQQDDQFSILRLAAQACRQQQNA